MSELYIAYTDTEPELICDNTYSVMYDHYKPGGNLYYFTSSTESVSWTDVISDEYAEMKDCQIGWDVTDFGSGDFHKRGLFLMTIRNGCFGKYPKPYAEKIMVVEEKQVTPMHFHWNKMEDIINKGGGNLLIRVYNSTADEDLDKVNDVHVHLDGREVVVPAGTQVRLTPGESISIQPYLYHDFEVEKGSGPVLIGEVSQCNDDNTDNRFYEPIGRFPSIEEDEAPYRLLCNEYPAAK